MHESILRRSFGSCVISDFTLFLEIMNIYENLVCELRSEELFEGRSSQLYTQLLQLRKESLKKIQRSTAAAPVAEVKGLNPVQA